MNVFCTKQPENLWHFLIYIQAFLIYPYEATAKTQFLSFVDIILIDITRRVLSITLRKCEKPEHLSYSSFMLHDVGLV